MDVQVLLKLLQSVASGQLSPEAASRTLSQPNYDDLGYARVDHQRELRQGIPEVVFGEGKTAEQLIGIVGSLDKAGQSVLVTRVTPEKADVVLKEFPDLKHSPKARTLSVRRGESRERFKKAVAIVSAGTSDQPVAEEAAETLLVAGVPVERFYDVGVAGIHRLFDVLPKIQAAPAVICAAGMEGALPSVLGGLLRQPLIAVPTSVGYGTALEGFTALFGMLTGCSSGVTVVNIDNGFGAAMAVLRMSTLGSELCETSESRTEV